MSVVFVLVGAFALGSIPFSYLVARVWGVADVRKVGSGNVGATNVMRSAGKLPGIIAFVLDFLKGALASLLALKAGGPALLPALAAAAAVLGHMFPPWLGFKGGKGVATGAGAFLPLVPAATGAALVVFAASALVTGYVSLGSICGTIALAATAFLRGAPPEVAWSAAATGSLIVWRHRGNIERIMKGSESRIGPRGRP